MVFPHFEIHSFNSSLGLYSYDRLPYLWSPHPKSNTCSPKVETEGTLIVHSLLHLRSQAIQKLHTF